MSAIKTQETSAVPAWAAGTADVSWAINFDPVPLTNNLPTIGLKAVASLSNDPMEVFDPMPSTPPVPTTLQTPTLQSSSSEDHKVSEDVIQSLVIPSKSKGGGGRRLVKGKKRGTGALLNFCLLLYLGRAEQKHTPTAPTTNRG